MDDLLQRMLAIDQQADKLVQAAEAEAAKIMEATRTEISEKRKKAQAELLEECDEKLRLQVEKAKKELENKALAETELEKEVQEFSKEITAKKQVVFDKLVAL
jgi:F0F1-type ATP synthase membrane subunit b/b'